MNAGAGISASCRRFGRNLMQVSLTSGWRRHKRRAHVCETSAPSLNTGLTHEVCLHNWTLKGSEQKREALSSNTLMCSSQHTAGRPL